MRSPSRRSIQVRALGRIVAAVTLASAAACGARTELLVEEQVDATTDAPIDGASDAATDFGADAEPDAARDAGPDVVDAPDSGCVEGTTQPCGSSVGACKPGTETCHHGVFGACEGAIGPKPEACNGIDENCNGTINDCDPGSGTCTPTLTVTGSTPSSPSCIDFPVSAGGMGTITYTCPGSGGTVTATLGGVSFTGTVTDNVVSLDAFTTEAPPTTPDGCTWQQHHHIEGKIQSGSLQYTYSEAVLVDPPGAGCWSPCTEVGTVAISWPTGG